MGNKRIGFGVYLHPITAQTIEAEFGYVADAFFIGANKSDITITYFALKELMLAYCGVDFSGFTDARQENLSLSFRSEEFWNDLFNYEARILFLTEGFHSIQVFRED